MLRKPSGLGDGGRALWDGVTKDHPELDAMQVAQLTEACRMKDRCDKLDELLRGNVDVWAELVLGIDGAAYELRITSALDKANATANTMKQLLAALRLPDAEGKRPQQRPPRGAQAPSIPGGNVSSIDRARSRKGA